MIPTTASVITQAASKQTYYTIQFLVDRQRVNDAYRAYAYFRWVDDTLDAESIPGPERIAFLNRQEWLLEKCYQDEPPRDASIQEKMLVELIQHDQEKNSGLLVYLRNMMQVMHFDVNRRGRLISQGKLNDYARWLATAVMECAHYFIGHDDFAPRNQSRYLAVSAAHIMHMLRDTFDDVRIGYYNIPREILDANHISSSDVNSDAYRAWVKSRILLAQEYFEAGKAYLTCVQNLRCRMACFAYMARFESLLDRIQQENYLLRPKYGERKSIRTELGMSLSIFSSLIHLHGVPTMPQSVSSQSLRKL